MAYVRQTKNSGDNEEDSGSKSSGPNVGKMVIAGAPPATKTSVDAANADTGGDNKPAAQANKPAAQASSGSRGGGGGGGGGGQSRDTREALMRAKADAEVDAGGDSLSPTTLVLNYLRQQGMPRTSENVRRALEANMRTPGVIPGMNYDYPANPTPVALVNDVAGRDPVMAARVAASQPSSGPANLNNVAPVVEGGPLPGGQSSKLPDYLVANMPFAEQGFPPIGLNRPPLEPAPVTPGGPPALPPPPAGAAAIPPPQAGSGVPTVLGGNPPAVPGAEYAGRAPLQPSGRMIDQPGVALPPPNPTPALPSPVSESITKALQGPTGSPRVAGPAPTPQVTGPAPQQALPAPSTPTGPPRIQATNPRMGVPGLAGQGIREMARSGARNIGPLGLAGLILGGKSILDELRNPGSQPDITGRYGTPRSDKSKSDSSKTEKKE